MKIASLTPGKIARKLVERLFPDPGPSALYTRAYIHYEDIDPTPRSEEAVLKTMRKGFDVLDELGVSYGLGRGSILGLHRDGKFLPGDIDIDIDIFSDKKIYKIIEKLPFEMMLCTISEGKYQQLAFIDKETEVIFDIWFYHEENGEYLNRNYFGYFNLPKDKVENLSEISMGNATYPSLDPAWFVKYWYGENWNTPMDYNADWTIDYRRDCSAFTYTGEKNIVPCPI